MSRYELELRIDAPGADDFGGAITEESDRVRTRVYRELRLKVHSNAWVRLDPESVTGRQKLQALVERCEAGEARAGTANLREQLDENESAACDWFVLFTKVADDSFSLWDDYPTYKLSDIKGDHAYSHSFVSRDFVDVCNESGLRGISFLRCQQRGRKPGPTWFAALPDGPLGRGLDHPWFDRQAWLAFAGDDRNRRSTSPGTGQYAFHQSHCRLDRFSELGFSEPLLKLFPQSRPNDSHLLGLNFVTVPRFWNEIYPDADFAYVIHGEDGPNRDGKMMRFRQLMVSRNARRILIDAGLFPEKVFLGVRSVDAPEPGVEILDSANGPVSPMWTAEETVTLRAREKTLFG